METIDVDLKSGIQWPSKCAYCNGDASTEEETHFRVIDGFYLIAIRETTHTVRYPVCAKHKRIAKFYGFFTNQAWPTGFVMVLTFPLVLCLPITLGTNFGSKFSDEVAIVTYVLFALWVIYLKVRNPVKVVMAKKNLARIRLANDQYAEEFRRINAAHPNA